MYAIWIIYNQLQSWKCNRPRFLFARDSDPKEWYLAEDWHGQTEMGISLFEGLTKDYL